jgi:hypothetical protein
VLKFAVIVAMNAVNISTWNTASAVPMHVINVLKNAKKWLNVQAPLQYLQWSLQRMVHH